MSLEKVLAISGKPGLFKLITQTKNGFVAESLIDKKKLSVSVQHNVSILSEIAIYTLTEEVPLKDILIKIKSKENSNPTIPRTVKVAAAQILTDDNIENNEKKITTSIIEAAGIGCEIIIFHEGCLTNYPVKEAVENLDFVKVRAAEKRILSLSKKYNIAILLGSSSKEDGRYYNHVVIANEKGNILGRYVKTWRAGDKPYEAGTGPVIFTVAGVEATVIICHDLRYPELARLGVAAGAQIVFIANNESGVTREDKLLGYRSMQISRATENMVFSVMANSPADPEDIDRNSCSHGNSNVVDPLGNMIDEAGSYEERLVVGTLNLEEAHRSTVLRTMGEDESLNEYYGVEYENLEFKNWMMNGLKLVRRLDGQDVPEYLISD